MTNEEGQEYLAETLPMPTQALVDLMKIPSAKSDLDTYTAADIAAAERRGFLACRERAVKLCDKNSEAAKLSADRAYESDDTKAKEMTALFDAKASAHDADAAAISALEPGE